MKPRTFLLSAYLAVCLEASPLPYAGQAVLSPDMLLQEPGRSASRDPNPSYFDKYNQKGYKPEPIRGDRGYNEIANASNIWLDKQNPDLLAPPSTDIGKVANAKWPFSLSHNRLESGGWAREQNVKVLPSATQIAGVNMRLKPGAYRELHWHLVAEWAYMLKGSATISVVNTDPQGQNFIADVVEGGLWYFPAGIPHSIQANDPDIGCEFLLVFDDGNFSEDDTFLVSDWTAHVPKSVLNKNFGFEENSTVFDHLPADQLYIFNADDPGPAEGQDNPKAPGGTTIDDYVYRLNEVEATKLAGGSIKTADSTNFKISKTIAAAEIEIMPGGMRELHWHPNSDEWDYFISGEFRAGIFASNKNTRTFNFQAGDVGYIDAQFGHYLECISKEPCKYLEIFKAAEIQDLSLAQWMALTPTHIIKDTLRVDPKFIRGFNKEKQFVVPPV